VCQNFRIYRTNYCKSIGRMHSAVIVCQGDPPFDCKTCGRKFSARCNLLRHIRLHTGERPYACDVCGKTFVDQSTLRQHCLVHSGDKPFQCSVCNKRFLFRKKLKIHQRLHTGDCSIHSRH